MSRPLSKDVMIDWLENEDEIKKREIRRHMIGSSDLATPDFPLIDITNKPVRTPIFMHIDGPGAGSLDDRIRRMHGTRTYSFRYQQCYSYNRSIINHLQNSFIVCGKLAFPDKAKLMMVAENARIGCACEPAGFTSVLQYDWLFQQTAVLPVPEGANVVFELSKR